MAKPKMTEMSKPAEILYRAFFDELRFAKQQQWTITNYVLVLMGALFGVVKLTSTSPTSCEKALWWVVVAAIWGTGLFMLLHLQTHMRKTRDRQQRMKQNFSPEDRRLVDPPTNGADARDPVLWRLILARLYDIEPFAVLCSVVTGAGILTCYAIGKL
jgi:hypothetical protein